jgi:hypothetical protein
MSHLWQESVNKRTESVVLILIVSPKWLEATLLCSVASNPTRTSACQAAAKGEDSYICKYVESFVAITDITCHNLLGCSDWLYSRAVFQSSAWSNGDLGKCGRSEPGMPLCVIYVVNLSMHSQNLVCEHVVNVIFVTFEKFFVFPVPWEISLGISLCTHLINKSL